MKWVKFSILSCFQARQDRVGSWPWCEPWDGGLAEARFRYSLTTLTVPRRCLGMARRRVGRGGRSVQLWFAFSFTPAPYKTYLEAFLSNYLNNLVEYLLIIIIIIIIRIVIRGL